MLAASGRTWRNQRGFEVRIERAELRLVDEGADLQALQIAEAHMGGRVRSARLALGELAHARGDLQHRAVDRRAHHRVAAGLAGLRDFGVEHVGFGAQGRDARGLGAHAFLSGQIGLMRGHPGRAGAFDLFRGVGIRAEPLAALLFGQRLRGLRARIEAVGGDVRYDFAGRGQIAITLPRTDGR